MRKIIKNDNEEEKNDHRLSDLGNVDKKDELLLEDNKDILIKNIIYDKGNILKEQNDMMKKEICYDDFNRNIFHSNDIEHINKIKEEEFTNKNIYIKDYIMTIESRIHVNMSIIFIIINILN